MKKGAGTGPQYVMLGRVVVHDSPATLAKYGPRTMTMRVPEEPAADAFAEMPSVKIGRGLKGFSAKDVVAYAKVGAAIGSYFRDTKWGTDTQSAGYQAQRAGERASY